jgi:hypothetical protein
MAIGGQLAVGYVLSEHLRKDQVLIRFIALDPCLWLIDNLHEQYKVENRRASTHLDVTRVDILLVEKKALESSGGVPASERVHTLDTAGRGMLDLASKLTETGFKLEGLVRCI